ncbi:MAG: peptidoglycan D,D-transpeptidase FtsI family protein, partial [Desulfobacterales bacterium]
MKLRIAVVGLIFGLFISSIVARAIYLQIFYGTKLSQRAAYQYEKSFIALGMRGTIYDRKFRTMAVSTDLPSVAAYPRQIEKTGQTAKTLARELPVNRKVIYRKLQSKRSFVWIIRHASPRQTLRVKNLKLKGVGFISERRRFYPNKTLAGQILGFSGLDGYGLEGLEFYYNTYLEGDRETYKIVKDALGREFDGENGVDASGENLILTMDQTIQYITESALAESVKKYAAKSGIAIVMDPETGGVLALAHYPFFNPNSFQEFNKATWRNRAITDPFEPGSTLKIFTAAGALKTGEIEPTSLFFCENGAYRIGRNTVNDTHPYGWLTLEKIVKYSSNIGAVKVSQRIGPERLYKNLKAFGFGKRTGIDSPGETPGRLTHFKRWSKIDSAAIAFGQGISVSAIQLITAVSAIANEGQLMAPFIVQAITNARGRIVKRFRPRKVRQAISKENAIHLKKMMQMVVEPGGTGVKAAVDNFLVGGKTGTAQKVGKSGTYARGKYVASFVGFAP